MLKGFDEQTKPLNDQELSVAQDIKVGLNQLYAQHGDRAHVSNKRIRQWLKINRGITLSPARIRKIMNWARVTGYIRCVGADSKGYWISTNKEDQVSYVQSLNGRINAILKLRNAYMEQCNLKPEDIPYE